MQRELASYTLARSLPRSTLVLNKGMEDGKDTDTVPAVAVAPSTAASVSGRGASSLPRSVTRSGGGARVWLGTFDSAEEAARVRPAYAQRGATAVLNCPGEAGRVAGNSSSVAPSASSRGMGRWNGERIELECLDDRVLDDLLDKDRYGGK